MQEDILKIIGLVFGSGIAGAFLSFKLGNRKQDNSEFTSIVSEYKELVLDYKNEVLQLRIDVDNLTKYLQEKRDEVKTLRNQLMIFESSHSDIPIPVWLKDTQGRMLFVNQEYENQLLNPIGKTADDYIGSLDKHIWGKDVANVFIENDREVMRKKRPIEFTEKWVGANGQLMEGRLIKYPRFLNGKTVIGIGGIIIEIKKVYANNKKL